MHVHLKNVTTPSSTSTATLCIFVLCTTTYTLGDPQILQYWRTETRSLTFKICISIVLMELFPQILDRNGQL